MLTRYIPKIFHNYCLLSFCQVPSRSMINFTPLAPLARPRVRVCSLTRITGMLVFTPCTHPAVLLQHTQLCVVPYANHTTFTYIPTYSLARVHVCMDFGIIDLCLYLSWPSPAQLGFPIYLTEFLSKTHAKQILELPAAGAVGGLQPDTAAHRPAILWNSFFLLISKPRDDNNLKQESNDS